MSPRYDGPRVLRIDGAVGDPSVALLRQRRRLADVLATLGPEQWATPSRCAVWSVQDVVTHLAGINQLWEQAIAGGLAGAPTRLFDGFDPVVTPAMLVDAERGATPAATLAAFVETTESLAGVVAGVAGQQWSLTGETPLGHVRLLEVATHALWDGWAHERDVLIPIGVVPVEEADEVDACLRYAAAIGPGLLAVNGSSRPGTITVAATDPDVHLVVEAGAAVVVRDGTRGTATVRLAGRAVDLIEALTFRAPLAADVAADDAWLLGGLAQAFDLTG